MSAQQRAPSPALLPAMGEEGEFSLENTPGSEEIPSSNARGLESLQEGGNHPLPPSGETPLLDAAGAGNFGLSEEGDGKELEPASQGPGQAPSSLPGAMPPQSPPPAGPPGEGAAQQPDLEGGLEGGSLEGGSLEGGDGLAALEGNAASAVPTAPPAPVVAPPPPMPAAPIAAPPAPALAGDVSEGVDTGVASPEAQAFAAAEAARIEARAAAVAASIRAQGETQAAALLASAATAEGSIREAQAAQIAAIDAAFSAAGAALEAQMAAAQAEVLATSAADKARAAEAIAAGRQQGEQGLTQAISAAQSRGDAAVNAPTQIANEEGDRGAREVEAAAARAESEAGGVASKYGGDEKGNAMAAAAREVGTQTAAGIREKAPGVRNEVAGKGGELVAKNREAVTKLMTDLNGIAPQLATSMTQLSEQAASGIGQIETATTGQLNALKEKGSAGLETARQAAINQVNAIADQAVAQVQAEAEAGATQVRSQAEAGATALESAGFEVAAGLREAEGPDVGAVSAMAAQADGVLGQAEAQANQGLAQAGAEAQAALMGVATQAQGQMAAVDPGAAIEPLKTQMDGAIAEVKQGQVQAGNQAVQQAGDGAKEAGNKAVEEANKAAEQTLKAVENDNQQFRTDMAAKVNEAVAKAAEPANGVAGRAQEAANKAAAEMDKPWYKKAWDGIWSALGNIVKGLLIFVAITAILVILAVVVLGATLSWALIAACAVIAGIALLIYALVQSVRERMNEGHGFFASLGLGLLDVTGLTKIYEAATGDDTHSDRTLTAEERWQRGTEGVFELAMTLLMIRGGVKAIRGKPGGAEAPKTEVPKTEAPKTEVPKTETPKTEVPKTETPKTETPKIDPEAPKTEAPKIDPEAPKTETPKVDPEAPKTEAPKTETPKTEQPKTEQPKTEQPKTEQPKPDPQTEAYQAEAATRIKTEGPGEVAKINKKYEFDGQTEPPSKIQAEWEKAYQDAYVRERAAGADPAKAGKTARAEAKKAATALGEKLAIEAAQAKARAALEDPSKWNLSAGDKKALADYQAGNKGGSAQRLSPELTNKPVADVISTLEAEVAAGRATKTSTTLPNGKPQTVYQFPDGTVIRVKPQGDAFVSDPSYSVEVTTDGVTTPTGQEHIAFKIGPDGKPVPKGPDTVPNPYNKGTHQTQFQAFLEWLINAGHLRTKE